MQTLETASRSFVLCPTSVVLYLMETGIMMGTAVCTWPLLQGTRNSPVHQETTLVQFRCLQVRFSTRNKLAVLYDSKGILREDSIIVIGLSRSQRPK